MYFISHFDGRKTGVLLRTWDTFFDKPPPSAYGANEEEVFRQLEVRLRELEVTEEDILERYLWEESFQSQEVLVEVHPLTVVKKRSVIGKKRIPLHLTYVFSKLASGAYRVMLPRFGGWYILEDLALAPEILRQAVSTMMMGEKPRSIYDFRREGEEYVREWSPRFLLRMEESDPKKEDPEEDRILARIADDLVDKAVHHRLPTILGEGAVSLPTEKTQPGSLLLVGGPGSGKTTWVHRVAQSMVSARRANEEAPTLWSTSAERILSGMVYLGMWQERCLRIVEELSKRKDFLHIERLAPLLRAQPDGSSIAEFFQPAMETHQIQLLIECSEEEFERCQQKFPSFLALFRIIRIEETSQFAMIDLLDRYQHRKGVARVTMLGLKRLVQHLSIFQPGTCFPGKGFRFVDWLYQERPGSKERRMTPYEISEAYSRYSGLPINLIADDVPAGAEVHAQVLQQRVIGQEDACHTAARVLARFKAGLNDPERPCGTMLFVGPTGVGKTELAKQIARYMFGNEDRMIRLDMSEYILPGSAARMMEIGRGVSSLAQRVREQPLSLILLDEIEKAHVEVFDLLLGVLGEGRLTDSLGNLVDFRMTIFVMTSNLGAGGKEAVGFGNSFHNNSFSNAVRQHFRPEFFNRIDYIVSFRSLEFSDLIRIVDLELEKANQRTGIRRRGLRIHVSPEARALLARLGYHPIYGARPLKRIIEERIITPVAIQMAQDPELRDQEILVSPQWISTPWGSEEAGKPPML